MRLIYQYLLLFFLMMTFGIIIGYNIDGNLKASRFPMEILDSIENQHKGRVNATTLQLLLIKKVLSQLDSSAKIRRVVSNTKSFSIKNLPTFVSCRIDSKTVYIRLSSISAGAYQIFAKNLDSKISSDTKKITFDLRGVDGDAFDDAIEIADEFLSGDKLITYTQSAHQIKREYRAQRPGLFEDGELNLLIDSLTSGPSEIICAAIKYWKRGKLIGNITAGNTVKRESFYIMDNYEMLIPTLRYYSPNGIGITRLSKTSKIDGVLPDITVTTGDELQRY